MKTIEEMIAVMTAYKNGKKIECKSNNMPCADWFTIEKPSWDWLCNDYRIKPDPLYKPYDSVSEVEKDKWLRKKKHTNSLSRIVSVSSILVSVYGEGWLTVKELFEKYEYEDGSHCGKLVEE